MNSRGFTLIETAIAALIIAGALLFTAMSWSGNLMRIEKSRINAQTAALLQQKITEFELRFKDKPISEVPETLDGDFGDKFKQYSWEMISQDFKMPDISAALTSKEGGANDLLLQIVKTFTEALNKSIKEIKVTVIYKTKAGKSLRNSVTTYLVDYSQEIPLGPAGVNATPTPQPQERPK